MSHQEIQPDRVAIYIRWSTDDQSDGTTLAVQSEACKHYVQSQGWEVRDDLIFIDDGYSGGSLERPALTKLRRLVKEGLIDCVVVFKLDRLSRSVIDTVTLVLQEWEDLTHVKSAREPVDTTTAMGKQFFYMLVSYAEWERNVIRERMFGGKLRRAKEGRSPGMPAAYGYQKGPKAGSLEIVESEARVVKMVYDMAERGIPVRQITIHLNKLGLPSRRGAPWGTSMVSKMLHNPIYTGTLVWGRRRVNPRYGKHPGERRLKQSEPHVVVEDSSIPGIISEKQFEAVQAVMSGNKKIARAAVGSEHLLTGLLKCARCGRAMQYNSSAQWSYYRCGARTGQKLCDAPSIPSRVLEAKVLEELKRRYLDQTLSLAEAKNASFQSAKAQELLSALDAVKATLAKLEAQEKRVNQDYLQERINAQDRRELLAHIQTERAACARAKKDVESQVRHVESLCDVRKATLEQLKRAVNWTDLESAEQKQILRFFIQSISAERIGPKEADLVIDWFESTMPAVV